MREKGRRLAVSISFFASRPVLCVDAQGGGSNAAEICGVIGRRTGV